MLYPFGSLIFYCTFSYPLIFYCITNHFFFVLKIFLSLSFYLLYLRKKHFIISLKLISMVLLLEIGTNQFFSKPRSLCNKIFHNIILTLIIIYLYIYLFNQLFVVLITFHISTVFNFSYFSFICLFI